MSVLQEIIEKKRQRLREAKDQVPFGDVRRKAEQAEEPRDFMAAIERGETEPLRLIAELKKASPSRGLIRPGFDPEAIARIYDEKADAVSVLTEQDFFEGGLEFIGIVKAASGLPALRKDFIFDEYQIYEARAAGADAILLIAMALQGSQAAELMELAHELAMDVLMEVHSFDDLERALEMECPLIGVNNRDLRTLEVDLSHTLEIMREVPGGVRVVSESGISNRKDVLRLEEAGVDAMLVGTAFMSEDDIAGAIDRLRGGDS